MKSSLLGGQKNHGITSNPNIYQRVFAREVNRIKRSLFHRNAPIPDGLGPKSITRSRAYGQTVGVIT